MPQDESAGSRILNENLSEDQQLYSLWRAFSKVRRAIWKASEKELSRYDITPEQAGVLYMVRNVIPNASQSEISRQMLIEHHTISGTVKRMEAKGLIRREVDAERRNVIRVSLTGKGEEVYRQSVHRRSVRNVFSVLSPEERRQLANCLEKMLPQALEELEQYYTSPFSVPHEVPKTE